MTGQIRAHPAAIVQTDQSAWASGFMLAALVALATFTLAPDFPPWSPLYMVLGVFVSWAVVTRRTDTRYP
jgi:hypothetical protein